MPSALCKSDMQSTELFNRCVSNHWTEIWNGTVEWNDECEITANLCNWHCLIWVELSTMTLGLLSHHRDCMSKCSLSGVMMSQSENGASLNRGPLYPSATTKATST